MSVYWPLDVIGVPWYSGKQKPWPQHEGPELHHMIMACMLEDALWDACEHPEFTGGHMPTNMIYDHIAREYPRSQEVSRTSSGSSPTGQQ